MKKYLKENRPTDPRLSTKPDLSRTAHRLPLHPKNNNMASRLLERQILELEQEIQELESIKNSNYAIEERISLMLGDLEHTRELKDKKKRKLEQDVGKIQDEWKLAGLKLKKVEAKVEEMEENIEMCCEDFERREEACQKEERRLEELEEKAASLETENGHMQDATDTLNNEVKAKKQKTVELKDQIFAAENEIKSIEKQKDELRRAIAEIEGTIKRVDKEEFEFDSMLVRKTQKESDLETESEYLIKELEMFKDERDRLELEVNDLSLGVKSLKEGGQQIDQMKGRNQLLLETLREEKIRLITQVEMKRARVRGHKEFIEKVEARVKELGVEKEQLSRQSQECRVEKEQLERELDRQREINARVKHFIQGQKYLEGFLEKSQMKNQSMMHNM